MNLQQPKNSFVNIEENGLIRVQRDEKFGVCNRYGELILPVEYDAIGKFSCGLAIISKNNKSGYINDSARIIIPVNFDFDSQEAFKQYTAYSLHLGVDVNF